MISASFRSGSRCRKSSLGRMFDSADYELCWPREQFVGEAEAVLAREKGRTSWIPLAERLLEEAFAGPEPVDSFRAAGAGDFFAAFAPQSGGNRSQRDFLSGLVSSAPHLQLASEPRAYWSRRRSSSTERVSLTADDVMDRFVHLVDVELESNGYLERFVPRECVDAEHGEGPSPSAELQRLLGQPDLWPLPRSRPNWDVDQLFDLIEVFHDLVARPRSRWFHEYGGCGWHFSDLAIEPGRQLYRWRVNRLLDESELPYRLAESGEDRGRLVAVSDAARTALTIEMSQRRDPTTGDRVRHAIALHRGRGATRDDKRAAIRDLADILEHRRATLRTHLLKRDEADLFEIANRFEIRHFNEQQKGAYSDEFLDWLFWWYLATVELSDRLLGREATASGA